ncbi:ComF family protein [Schinkia azotoformans]|uniref:Late competence protein n=1 Tax=Schinkia azotoformans LMG 9581 TaxID=1131731 RepID=K6E372_SCHAZ|nr:ComF family protein [Schinkia azotoformans]EKN67661.1 late competence protein [Schinkia azotoformans LMG 9581]MEC1637567.1 ComF family protein [Schinkia azotoformans]MEC1943971.1 ComF family protein [Schinkia azotoformans]
MHCLICHQPLTEIITWSSLFTLSTQNDQPQICNQCNQKLEPITGEQCRICSRPFSKLEPKFRKQDLCYDCYNWERTSEWQGLLTQNTSIFNYNDFLKDLLAQFKFRGDHELVKIFTEPIQTKFKQMFDQKKPPIIIPVPLSIERQYERGFNQAQSLASLLSQQPIEEILERSHTEKQSKKKRSERLLTDSPFHLKADINPAQYKNKNFLIIDDIYTTGITLRQIAKVLQPLSPNSIKSLTLARS